MALALTGQAAAAGPAAPLGETGRVLQAGRDLVGLLGALGVAAPTAEGPGEVEATTAAAAGASRLQGRRLAGLAPWGRALKRKQQRWQQWQQPQQRPCRAHLAARLLSSIRLQQQKQRHRQKSELVVGRHEQLPVAQLLHVGSNCSYRWFHQGDRHTAVFAHSLAGCGMSFACVAVSRRQGL